MCSLAQYTSEEEQGVKFATSTTPSRLMSAKMTNKAVGLAISRRRVGAYWCAVRVLGEVGAQLTPT